MAFGRDAGVKGAEKLEALGKRFKAAGGPPLRRELLRGIRESNKPTIARIRERADAELPHSGGLAEQVASNRIATRSRLSGRSAGVRITMTGRMSLSSLNAGRLRHPVFGNRSVWVQQSVPAHWFDDPVREDLPQIRQKIDGVMKDVARKIERG